MPPCKSHIATAQTSQSRLPGKDATRALFVFPVARALAVHGLKNSSYLPRPSSMMLNVSSCKFTMQTMSEGQFHSPLEISQTWYESDHFNANRLNNAKQLVCSCQTSIQSSPGLRLCADIKISSEWSKRSLEINQLGNWCLEDADPIANALNLEICRISCSFYARI